MASQSLPEAPWKAAFQSHLSKMESPEFVFSSLHPSDSSSNGSSSTPYVPRARFCIFRGFWTQLPPNKHNSAPQNDRVYESECPTFTTDVRMHKVFEVFSSSAGHADEPGQTLGCGGGGPVEGVWWVKEAMTQWRIRGEAFVIGPDVEDGEQGEQSSGVRTVKAELGSRMRVVDEQGKEGWSWVKELTAHFGNLSPGMRGSFVAPPPGRPVNEPYDDKHLKLGEKVDDLEHPIARQNFRVVVIKPEVVESVDLSDPPTSRRQVYTFDEGSQSWSHQECWL